MTRFHPASSHFHSLATLRSNIHTFSGRMTSSSTIYRYYTRESRRFFGHLHHYSSICHRNHSTKMRHQQIPLLHNLNCQSFHSAPYTASSHPLLDPDKSHHEKGLLYERLCLETLNFLNIEATGQSHDLGVDFQGYWNGFDHVVLLGQCKNEKRKLSGRVVREMQGVVSRYHNEDKDPIGIIVSRMGFSNQSTLHHKQAHEPLILVRIDQEGEVKQWNMNREASKLLEGLVVHREGGRAGSDEDARISLWVQTAANARLRCIL